MILLIRYGEDSVSCQLKCEGKSGVQYQSLHPDSLAKLKTFELQGTRLKDIFTVICI